MPINKGYLTSGRTLKSDEVYTPFYAVAPLIKYIPKDKIIWFPFDEEWSAFYQVFSNLGYQVIRSHLKDGKDFFTYEPPYYDIIISNPPFSLKDDVLNRVKQLNKPFALLLPLNTLQGKRRFSYLENIQLLAFDSRIDYHTKGNFKDYTKGNHFASAYFCKGILPKDLIIEKLDKFSKPLKQNSA